MEDSYDLLMKLILVGDPGVGKTSLIRRYLNNRFCADAKATVGIGLYVHYLKVDGVHLKLQIWDTAGQERFRAMTQTYYRGAHAALCVYDVTHETSWKTIPYWVQEVKQRSMLTNRISIVGNKADPHTTATLEDVRTILHQKAKQYTQDTLIPWVETSCLIDNEQGNPFSEVIEKLCRHFIQDVHHTLGTGGKTRYVQKDTLNVTQASKVKRDRKCCN